MRHTMVRWLLLLAMCVVAYGEVELPAQSALTAISASEASELQAEVVSLFNHAYSSYLTHA